jgi:hypothetical protein
MEAGKRRARSPVTAADFYLPWGLAYASSPEEIVGNLSTVLLDPHAWLDAVF